MKTVLIIQARVGSTRLPGKVLKVIKDKTVLEHVVSRVQQATGFDQVIVATSTLSQDDNIEHIANKLKIGCYRGSEHDVLNRYYEAAKHFKADIIVRITSDCPLLDPDLLTKMCGKFFEDKPDYLGNSLVRTYPRGLDIEIFTMNALEQSNNLASLSYQREHVTPFIYQNAKLFSLINQNNDIDLSHHRWTLDTYEDFEFISTIYDNLYDQRNFFTTEAILKLLNENPWIIELNKHVEQKQFLKE
jgi:spore coat polysaccharide biosynthesis protein SpsF